MSKPLNTNIEEMVDGFLKAYNLKGPNFTDTPKRVSKLWERFFNYGQGKHPDMVTFPTEYKGMVTMEEHMAWGFCPHHLLPVQYKFNISYRPIYEALGASKLARICNYHLRTLPLQEDLTTNIVNDLIHNLNCVYASCKISGWHLCYAMRGVKSESATFVTEWALHKHTSQDKG